MKNLLKIGVLAPPVQIGAGDVLLETNKNRHRRLYIVSSSRLLIGPPSFLRYMQRRIAMPCGTKRKGKKR